jgi:ATP-dependent DNA helicase RecG
MFAECTSAGAPVPELRGGHGELWVTFGYLRSASASEEPVQLTDHVTDQVISSMDDPLNRLLEALATGTSTSLDIQERLGLKHRPTFRENHLRPALQQGIVEMALPDNPKSPTQQYRLTRAGRARLSKLRRRGKS